MDRIKIHSGKLRAIGYEAAKRLLRVELEDGTALEYANVGERIWQQFKQSSAPWSYYRDHIEEEYSATRASVKARTTGNNPLDDLFG